MDEPRILITADGLESLYSGVPHWHACVLGPHPFGHPPEARFRMIINSLVMPTREEAAEACWAHAQSVCDRNEYVFDADEWDITHLLLVGGS